MPSGNETAAVKAARRTVRHVTRDDLVSALDHAVAEVERLAGEDDVIDLIAGLAAGQLTGDGPFTHEEAVAAWNAAADAAKDEYNPEGVETSQTIRFDSCGDLIVNLAVGFLCNPGRDTDDVIAEQWADLEPVFSDGFEVWNRHANDLGDYCPWSGQRATPDSHQAFMSGLQSGDDLCPQGCHASALEDPPKDSKPYKAAIVATVKEWIS